MQTTHSHHLEVHSSTLLKQLKPQIKIASIFLLVLSIAFLRLDNIFIILYQTSLVIFLLYLSKIKMKTYLKRLSIDIPFVLFAFFLPFLSKGDDEILLSIFGLSVYKTGFYEMSAILIKVTLCVTLAIVLTATTSNIELIYGLQKLKISPIFISILSFAIRYIDVFIDEFKRVKISMRSRGYSEKGIKALKPIAYASGAMLIRGYERGERVYNSMLSRGFKGKVELENRDYKSSSFILILSISSVFFSLLEIFVL